MGEKYRDSERESKRESEREWVRAMEYGCDLMYIKEGNNRKKVIIEEGVFSYVEKLKK